MLRSDSRTDRREVLVDATRDFANATKGDAAATARYKELFYALVVGADPETRRQVSAILARSPFTPKTIGYFFALDDIRIAAPFLLTSQIFSDHDFEQIIAKSDRAHHEVMARRRDLSERVREQLRQRMAQPSDGVKEAADEPPATEQPRQAEAAEQAAAPNANERPASQAKDRLLELAGRSGRLGRSPGKGSGERETRPQRVGEQLLDIARDRDRRAFAQALGVHCGLAGDDIAKLVLAPSADELIVVLKALDIPKPTVSRILLFLKSELGRQAAQFRQVMDAYDRLSATQCTAVLRQLGGWTGRPPAIGDELGLEDFRRAARDRRSAHAARPRHTRQGQATRADRLRTG